MAATKQKLKAVEAGNKISRQPKKPAQPPSKAAQTQNALKTREALQTRRAANADSGELAAMLSKKALAGDLDSARLFVKLADQKNSTQAVKKRRGLTYAQQLALAPPWQADPDHNPDDEQG